MDTLKQIKDSGIASAELWYLSTLVVTAILIIFIGILTYFIKAFFNRLQETLDSFADSIRELKDITKRHDWEIDGIKEKMTKSRR